SRCGGRPCLCNQVKGRDRAEVQRCDGGMWFPQMAPTANASVRATSVPPSASIFDLLRLLLDIARDAIRARSGFSLDATLRQWARRTAGRLESQNLIINLGLKRFLLVGSVELSRRILAQYPMRTGFSTGSVKKSAMAFLAPRALTISDDEDWLRRRAFNECVLQPGRPHEFRDDFARYT